jgi:hypothetical protein
MLGPPQPIDTAKANGGSSASAVIGATIVSYGNGSR